MAKLLEEIHPGEILLEDFMKSMGISARRPERVNDFAPLDVMNLLCRAES